MISFKELKEISQRVADNYGITYDDGAGLVASFSSVGDFETVKALGAGDYSAIDKQARKIAANIPDQQKKSEKEPAKGKPEKKTAKRAKKEKPETIAPKVYPVAGVYSTALEDYRRGELPETLTEDIKALLEAWRQDNGLDDLCKLASIQWSAACLFVGQWIKANKILNDIERERKEGGRRYDGEKVAALVPVWAYITSVYKHLPLHVDFISFSGVHRNYFYDYDGRGLTSTSVQIVKKVMEIENAALSVALTDSKENPTGRIFYSKARLGWRETDNIQPLPDHSSGNGYQLPDFRNPIS